MKDSTKKAIGIVAAAAAIGGAVLLHRRNEAPPAHEAGDMVLGPRNQIGKAEHVNPAAKASRVDLYIDPAVSGVKK